MRVEAGRLRRRLIEYYHAEGSDDAVRIALPKNGYAPTFTSMPAVSTPPALPSASKVRRTKRKLLLRGAVLGSIVATVAALVALFAWYRGAPPAPGTRSGGFGGACALGARVGAWAAGCSCCRSRT